MERTITGAAIKRAQITVKGKVFELSATADRFAICFGDTISENAAAGYLVVSVSALNVTRYKGDTYLDTGRMIFGPIDDAAACVIADLIKPSVTH